MMALVKEFKDFLFKSNAFALAIGIVTGIAVTDLVKGIVACFFDPLIRAISPGQGGAFTIGPFQVGAFLGIALNFIAVMAVVFLAAKIFLREKKEEKKEEAKKP